ncbi:MFS transporter [Micromonospora sp. NPDC005324]|uniref:MFS transporter n=1 Tax=Micromonospora sp. NPDC005324 TaxID=3157033 RepID=UPI0033B29F76
MTNAQVTPTRASPLRYPRFLRLWASQTAGAVADQVLPVALSLYVIGRGGGADAVAVILGGRAIALVVCLLVGGILADRVSRPRILMAADVMRAGVVGVALLSFDRLPLTALALVTALSGAAEALSRPAVRSLVPALLPAGLLERGNALVSVVQRSAMLIGALAGAALITGAGLRAALGLAGVMFALGAVFVLGIPDLASPTMQAGVLADAAEGLQAVRRRPWVLAVMAAVSVQLLAGTAPTLILLPLIAQDRLGGGLAYAVVLGCLAVGALPAIALASRWRPSRPGMVSMLALTAYALLPTSLAFALGLPLTAFCFALGGFAVELYFIYWLSALQRTIPAAVLGKALALDQLSAFALLPVGYALTGPAVAVLGAQGTLIAAAVLTAAACVLTLLVPGVSRFSDPPRRADGGLATAADVTGADSTSGW